MDVIKSISRRIFLWTFFVMTILCVSICAAFYSGKVFLLRVLPIDVLKDAAAHSDALDAGLKEMLPLVDMINAFFVPFACAVFFLFMLVLWVILRASAKRALKKAAAAEAPAPAPAKKEKKKKPVEDVLAEPVISKKEIAETNKRYYLHLLSVLQREGRLIDFFTEDLSLYEDDQIGAAVRSIQDNCKNSLKKHLNPKPVMDQNEGEAISVPAGFDANTIKLTGNVSGEPPFQGVLRHKGWRAARLELPALSVVKDPSVLAPAEVEVV